MSKKPINRFNIKKVALTQRVENAEKQLIVSAGVNQDLALLEGHFLALSFGHGFSIHGGMSNELINSTIVSIAPLSLIVTILLQGKLDFGYDDLLFNLDSSHHALGVAVNLSKPANFKRNIFSNNHVNKLNLTFTHEWIRERLGASCSMSQFTKQHKSHVSFQVTTSILEVTTQIISSVLPKTFSEKIKLEALSYKLFYEIIEQLTSNNEIENSILEESEMLGGNDFDHVKNVSPCKTVNKIDSKVEAMVGYIESHLEEDLHLDQIADHFSMSVSNLQRKFKKELRLTVSNYIRYRRLEIAKNHLEQGLLSVTEAAYEAGYHHPTNFTSAFKKVFGQPPTIFVKS